MQKSLVGIRTPFLFVVVLSALAAACAPPARYEPIIRKPVPTLSQPVPAEKGILIVARGDSLYKLARLHGVALRGLIQENRLSPPYVIYPGQRLRLPRANFHVVKDGETVYTIARRYNVDMGSLVRINDIAPPYRIESGRHLRLPDGRATDSAPKRVVASAATVSNDASDRPARRGIGRRHVPAPEPVQRPVVMASRPDPGPLKSPPPRSGKKFLWPVRGKVIVAFGARKGGLHNDGINIAARKGTAIKAAENGVVAYAGNQLQGFGNLILIKHSGGWMSAYAHGSVLLVRRGDIVQRGQVIARVGRTGSVSRPQLHFELRKGERAVDPRGYLVRFARLSMPYRFTSTVFRDARQGPG